jgi:hypothetical protein
MFCSIYRYRDHDIFSRQLFIDFHSSLRPYHAGVPPCAKPAHAQRNLKVTTVRQSSVTANPVVEVAETSYGFRFSREMTACSCRHNDTEIDVCTMLLRIYVNPDFEDLNLSVSFLYGNPMFLIVYKTGENNVLRKWLAPRRMK